MAQDTCALRRAAATDAGAIECFLAGYAETSMFLRSNLAAHGLGASSARAATDFILAENISGICGVVGITQAGYVLAQMPSSDIDLSELRGLWAGRDVLGATGVPRHVTAALTALGIESVQPAFDQNEPLYALALDDLERTPIRLRAPVQQDYAMLLDWFTAYGTDTGTAFSPEEAERRATRAIENASVRVLMDQNEPVAMSAFNATVADMVQVGGVFVPEARRNHGYGRRVVAGHLQEARAAGKAHAILFAANPPAARAYEAMGFTRIGDYRIVMYADPVTI